ncbi:MAG TPA: DUF2306 domain-containing protein [Anaerolinea sp.]|nr:DUF2306 domain-containing protein [Anaerolinea sp.]
MNAITTDHTQAQGSGKPAPHKTISPVKTTRGARIAPAALILLSLIPLIFGAVRLAELAGGAEITPANARFFESPTPVVTHILSAGVFALLGALQFATGFRRRHPAWHRRAGRILVVCGLLVGLSGLWMTLFYSLPPSDGALLFALRLLFGSFMVVSIVLGFAAVRRRDMAAHRAWMMRGYAVGIGAATQMLTLMVGELVAGPPDVLGRALMMGAGWVINLAVAEWIIRKRPSARVRASLASVPRV